MFQHFTQEILRYYHHHHHNSIVFTSCVIFGSPVRTLVPPKKWASSGHRVAATIILAFFSDVGTLVKQVVSQSESPNFRELCPVCPDICPKMVAP